MNDDESLEQNKDDVAPGFMDAADHTVTHGVERYLLGLFLAALLTAASFYVVNTHLILGPGIPTALVVLAVAQIGVHLVFFLHITTDPDNTNNMLALAFGLLIVILIIAGSIWIMNNLDANMLPSYQQMMQMQR